MNVRFRLILESETGEQIDMTETANKYMISEIDGLSPPTGSIITSTYAGMDGSYMNNASIEKRNLVISFAMRGICIEKHRHALYNVVKPSRYIKVYYKTSGIDVYTEGYVETCEVSNFDALTSGQISIICPDPYWYSNTVTSASFKKITGAFHFPFPESDGPFPLGVYSTTDNISIYNGGDEIGFTIRLDTTADDNTPDVAADTPTIYNVDTGEYLQIKGEIMKGDVITINTKTGNKSVTLTRNGINSNIINRLVSGSTWLSLRAGSNLFHVEAKSSVKNLGVTLLHRNAYLGV